MFQLSADKTYALFDSANNKKLLNEITNQKIEAIIFPAIAANEIITDEAETILKNLNNFDWLIFPDVYSAEFFVELLQKFGIDLFEIDALRVCSIGESVADRLRFSQLHADVIPRSIKTLDILQGIKDYVFDEEEFENLRFLVLKEKSAELGITEELESLKSFVIELPVYEFQNLEQTSLAKPKALLKGGAADEFIFSSPLDVLNLSQIFQTEKLDEVLVETKPVATDSITSQALQEFRLIK